MYNIYTNNRCHKHIVLYNTYSTCSTYTPLILYTYTPYNIQVLRELDDGLAGKVPNWKRAKLVLYLKTRIESTYGKYYTTITYYTCTIHIILYTIT